MLLRPGIVYDQGYPDGIVIHQPFAGHLALTQEISVITHQDNDGILILTCLFQLFPDFCNFQINTIQHAVVTLYTVLILFGCVVAPGPPKAVEAITHRFGQLIKVFVLSQCGSGHFHILIQTPGFFLPEILQRSRIVGMGSTKTDG